jgi:threonine aldolase
MRQAGVLAAAGIIALETMVDCLAEDHARARRLAQGLAGIPGLILDPGTPYTNMIFCSLADDVNLTAAEAAGRLSKLGVLVGAVGSRRFRIVSHDGITDEDMERAVEAFGSVMRET